MTMPTMSRLGLAILLGPALAASGGGGGNSSSGGSVGGLSGRSSVEPGGNGRFRFPSVFAAGTPCTVSVPQQSAGTPCPVCDDPGAIDSKGDGVDRVVVDAR